MLTIAVRETILKSATQIPITFPKRRVERETGLVKRSCRAPDLRSRIKLLFPITIAIRLPIRNTGFTGTRETP